MTDTTVEINEEVVEEKERSPLFEMARRVLLAGVGAVALAQEEVEAFVNKLVERGEIAEKDGRKLIKEMMDKRRKKAESVVEEVSDDMDQRIETMLHRMNVPTKGDIEALSKKIATLTKKVDELKKS